MNELTRWIQKNQRTIGIIALILFVLGVYVRNAGVNIPFFSGSLIGGATSGFFSIGIILLVIGMAIAFLSVGLALPVGVPLILAGGLLAGGNLIIAITKLFESISSPWVAIILGIVFVFLIFRKKGK